MRASCVCVRLQVVQKAGSPAEATAGGGKRTDIYASAEAPVFCAGCKLHN